jgi:hypothetical protein
MSCRTVSLPQQLAFAGIDVVISAIMVSGKEPQPQLLQAAVAAKCSRFIPSSMPRPGHTDVLWRVHVNSLLGAAILLC